MRKIKFYATFGPSCHTQEVLTGLSEEGMTGIRLNLSHSSLAEAKTWTDNLKKIGKQIDLAIDLQGPELRIGEIEGKMSVEAGEQIVLTAENLYSPKMNIKAAKEMPLELTQPAFPHSEEENEGLQGVFAALELIPIPACLAEKLEAGQEVSINDGMLKLWVKEVIKDSQAGKSAVCIAKNAGELSSKKSISIKGVRIDNPVLTQKDRENLRAARTQGVTEVMLPFVRDGKDVLEVRNFLKKEGLADMRILAKVEHQEGVDNIDSIIETADCIVIARGDLGNRFPIWQVPSIQKEISKKCVSADREFMVVTQLLQSMVQNPLPTRAEMSDIYNAVMDGANSLMVTGETAVGKYPVEVMHYLVKAASQALKDLSL